MEYFKDETELYHWGILKQKWGVRRYQNYDGTLTDLGKKRYGSQSKESYNIPTAPTKEQMRKDSAEEFKRQARIEYDVATKAGKDGKASPAEKALRNTKDIVDESVYLAKKLSKNKPKEIDVSKMSDDDLRKQIDRMRKEKEYKQLVKDLSPQQIESGKEKVIEALELTGSIVTIGVGIAGIATAISTITSANKEQK